MTRLADAALAVLLLALVILGAGCGVDRTPPPATPEPGPLARALEGTVAQYAYLEGGGNQVVRGYGLVVGLAGNGSSEAPVFIRKQLASQMARHKIGTPTGGARGLSPDLLIRDKDTAVVVVSALIPPGTPKGAIVDATVAALPQSQTVSLDGGTLYECPMRAFQGGAMGTRESLTLATVKGPLFINPLPRRHGQGSPNLRKGRVIAGVRTTQSRKLRLILRRGDYRIAQEIQRRINQRFHAYPQVARAKSPSIIDLNIPRGYRKDFGRFLNLLLHLHFHRGPNAEETKARALAKQILSPQAPHESISLIWEAMGRQILPFIRDLYAHEDMRIAYFAARAGLRLGENQALDVILAAARNAELPFRMDAIAELGNTRNARAGSLLHELLNDSDAKTRIAAYEALRSAGGGLIERTNVDGQFEVDIVPSKGPFIIYAMRTGKARLVLFGRGMQVKRPVYFSTQDDLVTVHADGKTPTLGIYRRVGAQKMLSDELNIPFDIKSLLMAMGQDPKAEDVSSHVRGLGLTYSQVVRVVHRMCQASAGKAIPADFILQGIASDGTIGTEGQPAGRPNTAKDL